MRGATSLAKDNSVRYMNIASNYTLNVHLSAHRMVCRMNSKLNNNGRKGEKKKNQLKILEQESTVWEMRPWLGVSWGRRRVAMGYNPLTGHYGLGY